VIIWSQITSLVLLPFIGYLNDILDNRVIIPVTFLARGCLAFSFRYITDPRDWYSFFAVVLIMIVY